MTLDASTCRRNLLKIGGCFFSGFGVPLLGLASVPPAVLTGLTAYRWLSAQTAPDNSSSAQLPYANTRGTTTRSPAFIWIDRTLELVKKYRLNPLRAARAFSYVSVAMHDAIQSSKERHGDSSEHEALAVHVSASCVIEYLFPEEAKGRWTGEALVAASAYAKPIVEDWGRIYSAAVAVAANVVTRASTDGSARINAMAQPSKTIKHVWKGAPPLWATRPAEPGAAAWRTWLVPAAIGKECAPPVNLDESRYLQEIREVYQTHRDLTVEQKGIAERWNLDLGTVSPPGVWLMKATEKPDFQKLSLVEQTGLLSLLTTTMMDAFTACWFVKFLWWTERPITAIRRLYDSDFLPHVVTPSFPSYVSGHATVSGAASEILCALLPQYRDEWVAAADEAAVSRLYGGIHFRSDNEEGLSLGKKVASLAITRVSSRA